MDKVLLERLSVITDEEKAYLDGKKDVLKDIYFSKESTVSDSKLFASSGRKGINQVEVRTHTRFIDFPLHSHDFVEMMYVADGSIVHVTDEGKEIVLKKGGVLLMNRHVKHAIKRADAGDIGINFIISPTLFETVVREVNESPIITDFLIENLRNDGKPVLLQYDVAGVLPIENLMENLIYAVVYNKHKEPHILYKTLSLMLTYFVVVEDILVNKYSTSDYTEQLKNKIENYIRTNYKDASLTVLASTLGLSHTYLCKWISANMDCGFKEMLVEQRFKMAEYLLKTTDLSISDVAAAVGYENASYFYRCFRTRYGDTPKGVRKKKEV